MHTRVCRLYDKGDLRIETESVGVPNAGQVLIRVGRGGICGSDLHYFLDGGFGPVRIREPIIIGHEFAGTVEAVGDAVTGLKIGDKVGVNPSQPCGQCRYCREHQPQHCLEMRFMGSALRLPHEQGGFRERLVVEARQCVKGGNDISIEELASAEPLSVCLHAARNAGSLVGQKVLVNGAGPIGALCVAVARFKGAKEIIALDLFDKTLKVATAMGADQVINVMNDAAQLDRYSQDKGYFDVVFECSAAQAALDNVFRMIRPRGILVQVGVTDHLDVPLSTLVAKEVNWAGSHRFHTEYADAVQLISDRKIDVTPIITDVFAMDDVLKALEAASDRSRSVKVQVSFENT